MKPHASPKLLFLHRFARKAECCDCASWQHSAFRRCFQVSAVAPLRARCGSALRICVPSAACATCMLRVHLSIRRSEAPKAIAERPAAEQGGAEHSSTPDAAQGRSCLRIFLCLSQAHSRRSHWFVVRSGCFCYLCHARRPAHAAHARFLTASDARPLAPDVRALIPPRSGSLTALFCGADLPFAYFGRLCDLSTALMQPWPSCHGPAGVRASGELSPRPRGDLPPRGPRAAARRRAAQRAVVPGACPMRSPSQWDPPRDPATLSKRRAVPGEQLLTRAGARPQCAGSHGAHDGRAVLQRTARRHPPSPYILSLVRCTPGPR